jgi:hypothetical protein
MGVEGLHHFGEVGERAGQAVDLVDDGPYGLPLPQASRGDGDHRSRHSATFTLAERKRRARHRFASSRMSGSHRDLQRAPSAPRQHISITTSERARIFHSTRIARTLVHSCHSGSGESSPSRKSVACITVTNVSPPDQSHFLFANVARLLSQPSADREIRGPAISTVRPDDCSRFSSQPRFTSRPNSVSIRAAAQIPDQMKFLVGIALAKFEIRGINDRGPVLFTIDVIDRMEKFNV